MKKVVKELDALPRTMVGDGKKPNVYFVTRDSHTELITTDGDVAHRYWQSLPRNVESTLEDRLVGVLASTEPMEDSPTLVTHDDYQHMKRN